MADFTLRSYRSLLDALKDSERKFASYSDYIADGIISASRTLVMRHDVDLLPEHSLRTAVMEYELGIRGTYYFRAVPESWNEQIIRQIAELNHEVGYHYENLTTCNGNMVEAYDDFCYNLERLCKIVDVKTICMHGSPRSQFDSKDLWKKYDYKSLGLIGEPYLDTDFSQMFYLTDTGRRWDGYKVSVRDKIEGFQDEWIKQGLVFHSTSDVIKAVIENRLPDRIMFTVHPQRWNDVGLSWLRELLLQNAKNVVKRIIVK